MLAEDRRAGARVDEQREHHRALFVELADVQDLRAAHGAGGHVPGAALVGVRGDVRVALQAAERQRHGERRDAVAGRDAAERLWAAGAAW